ncbi:hypothetical protein ACWDFL_37575 [Streptomyces bungoensis]
MATTAHKKVQARLDALVTLRKGGILDDVTTARAELAVHGRTPQNIRLRRTYIRHDVPKPVERERNGLAREDQPPAARLIAPRGVAGRLHLALLYAAHCLSRPGRPWVNHIPVEPDDTQRYSWMRLLAVHARHTPGGRRVASPRVNRARQITEALKKLRDHQLVELPNTAHPFRDFQLLSETGLSTPAAPIPYSLPRPQHPGIDVPAAFFTRGWVDLLTPSETVAYLMWLDVHQNPDPLHRGEPYVTGVERAGHFGLGRDAYETHAQLEAFGLIDVEPDLMRHEDGKYQDYNPEGGSPPCHRVWLVPDGLDHDAAERIEPVLQAFAAHGSWARPLSLRATSRPQP